MPPLSLARPRTYFLPRFGLRSFLSQRSIRLFCFSILRFICFCYFSLHYFHGIPPSPFQRGWEERKIRPISSDDCNGIREWLSFPLRFAYLKFLFTSRLLHYNNYLTICSFLFLNQCSIPIVINYSFIFVFPVLHIFSIILSYLKRKKEKIILASIHIRGMYSNITFLLQCL